MNMIDCINVNLLTPYVDKMVSQFLNKSPDEPEVAQTVGLLVGLYSLCEVCLSPVWGALADRIGRKPALLIGLAGSVLAPIMFGLGQSLPVVFAARALDGIFCGNVGVTRTYLGEIVDESNEAKGFGFLSICFSVGLFIGPLLGGELVYPAQWAPGVFSGTVFDDYPFLLPNLTYACFAAVAWIIGAVFLEETLPEGERCQCRRRQDRRHFTRQLSNLSGQLTPGVDPTGAPAVYFTDDASEAVPVDNPLTAHQQKPCLCTSLTHVIIAFCALSGYTSANAQLFVLIVSFPCSTGGFGFGPQQIGALQTVAAAALMISNICVYPRATKRFGFLQCFLVGWCVNNLATLLFPVYGLFADPDKYGFWRYVPLACMQIFLAISGNMMFPTSFAFINRAAEGHDRGTVNGWANSAGALCRAFFPPAASFVLTIGSESRMAMGRYLPLFVNSLVSTLLLLVSIPGLRKIDQQKARQVNLQAPPRNLSNEGLESGQASRRALVEHCIESSSDAM
eukprot:TRINITY_DN70410_c0_g1_i1.p1 TRINITY_DN70410_c0_g1~~TRINITY_DN70410_c0_g1_i1.p1  ORF type:complete len:560 (+),score=31.04 TRINITY_DN70410_c0_g1_i1:158-1681(+)